ncbi:hypothetical protein DL770_002854 [Monosporascus sp. CRB-9-2]|nr:hypothetical protein DL770_002854 [Monosporascus sp. CRB-9-2]
MGDFWPGNIMLSLGDGSSANTELEAIFVFDWEFATCAPTAFDLAHFAAELWLDARFNSQQGSQHGPLSQALLSAMFSSYRGSGLDIDMQKIIYYLAGHVCCFVKYAPRTDDSDLNKTVLGEAVLMMVRAKEERWEELSQDPIINSMLDVSGITTRQTTQRTAIVLVPNNLTE